jgi:hypothetical protein
MKTSEQKAQWMIEKLGHDAYCNDPLIHHVIRAVRSGGDAVEMLCRGLKVACEQRQKLIDDEVERLMHAPSRPQFWEGEKREWEKTK